MYGALILVQILFGINYVVSQVILRDFPPMVWASLRIIIASSIMTLIAVLWKPKARPKFDRSFLVPLLAFTLLGTIINQSAFLKGLSFTTATNSAILNTLIPVFTLLIITLRGLEPLTLNRKIGFLLSFVGVLAMRKIESFTLSDKTVQGDLLTILNCASYGLFLSYSKDFLHKYDRVWVTAAMFMLGSLGITLLALPEWSQFQWPEMQAPLIGSMAFSIFGGTLITYFLNNWTLSYSTSSSVAIFIYLQPIVAGSLAWLWFDQPITARMVISSLLILVGVLMVLGVVGAKKTKILQRKASEHSSKAS
jgi:drug/metabolite transporter (DMT)-like permease